MWLSEMKPPCILSISSVFASVSHICLLVHWYLFVRFNLSLGIQGGGSGLGVVLLCTGLARRSGLVFMIGLAIG